MADQPSVDARLRDAEHRMNRSVEVFQHETATIRTGRADPSLLEGIKIDYYGTPTPLNQIATIAAPDPRLLTVQPWDRGAMATIEKDLLKADLGLTPSNDGQMIRLPIPQMTQERRQEMVKRLKRMLEDAHVAVRNVRRDCQEHLRQMEKDKQISQDDLRRSQDRLQKITDEHVSKAGGVSARKEAELMEV